MATEHRDRVGNDEGEAPRRRVIALLGADDIDDE